MNVLVLNSGSSSIKFSIFEIGNGEPHCLVDGELEGIGASGAILKVGQEKTPADGHSAESAIATVFEAVSNAAMPHFDAVGYRVVHPGAKLKEHQRITPEVLGELERAVEFAPLHDPDALKVIRAGMEKYPENAHYACFDTVFHRTMPDEATTYPVPLEYRERGVRRYGFHGLSCESIVRQIRSLGDDIPRRMVIAHLGSGCSITALIDGCSVDTTMGLTPTGGVVMGTRPGDLDPGLVLYLLRQQRGDSVGAVETMLNHASGLVALSGMANDVKAMRVAAGEGKAEAALALKIFSRSITKSIGGFCWLMGGLDALVFSGGIGEHDAATRTEIVMGLGELGVEIGPSIPTGGGIQYLSAKDAKTSVMIVPSQEDLMIAVHVGQMAGQHPSP